MKVTYPNNKYYYSVAFLGMGEAEFSEVKSADISRNPIEYREDYIATNHRQESLMKYGNVIFRHGRLVNQAVLNWIKNADSGVLERCNVIVTLYDDQASPIPNAVWTLSCAISVSCRISNDEVIEYLELAHEGIIRHK